MVPLFPSYIFGLQFLQYCQLCEPIKNKNSNIDRMVYACNGVVICRFYQQSNKLQENLYILKPLLKDGCDTRIADSKMFLFTV